MRRFLIPFLILVLISAGVLFWFLNSFSPFANEGEISLKTLTLFFIVLSGFLWPLSSLLIYLIFINFKKVSHPREAFRACLRIGAWVSFFCVFLLFFQLVGVFHLINILFLGIFLVVLELYFRSRQKEEKPKEEPGQKDS